MPLASISANPSATIRANTALNVWRCTRRLLDGSFPSDADGRRRRIARRGKSADLSTSPADFSRFSAAQSLSGLVHEVQSLLHVSSHKSPIALHDVTADDHGFYVGRAGAEDHHGYGVAVAVEVG